MKTVTDARGLSNLGTAISKRIRSRPPQEGTAHLELYLLDKERQRLRAELAYLEQRRQHFHRRLKEILEEMTRLTQEALADDGNYGGVEVSPPGNGNGHVPGNGNGHVPAPDYTRGQWKTIPIDY